MQLVDWDTATATATRLAPPGPRMDLADAVETVEQLKAAAAQAERHVSAYTGLPGGADGGAVAVVDRPGWIRSNVAGFRDLVDPLLDSVLSSRSRSVGPVMSAVGSRATDLDPAAMLGRLRGAVGSIADTVRGGSQLSLLEIVQTPEQRAVLDRVTGLMSLLEGHADVVMDGVGPAVVPSVESIRGRFEERRRSGSPLDRAVRRLLGMDMKLRQYAEGAVFVRTVLNAIGMDGLNRVWSAPAMLPDAAEIHD